MHRHPPHDDSASVSKSSNKSCRVPGGDEHTRGSERPGKPATSRWDQFELKGQLSVIPERKGKQLTC